MVGENHFYQQEDGDFSVFANKTAIKFKFSEKKNSQNQKAIDWDLFLDAHKGKSFEENVYCRARNRGRDYTHSSIIFSGCGFECGAGVGDYKILELKFDEGGKVESLTLNFNYCYAGRNNAPVFGRIRYNSSIGLSCFRICKIFEKTKEFKFS